MSLNNRYAVAAPFLATAVGLLLIATVYLTYAVSKGYESANQDHQTQHANAATRQQAQDVCLNTATSIQGFRECVSNIPQTSREQERAEQDLNAQREMAYWAEGMLWATLIVGFCTTLAASAAAWFAFGAVRETRRIGEAQVRAYLVIEEFVFQQEGAKVVARAAIKNVGQSPAQNMMIWGEIVKTTNPFDATIWERLKRIEGSGSLAGSQRFSVNVQGQISNEDVNWDANPPEICDLVFRIRHDDVFGQTHDTYCRAIVALKDGQYIFMATDPGK